MSVKNFIGAALVSAIAAIAPLHANAAVAQTLNAGYNHVCAVTTTGGAYCWGSNNLGQLGDGSVTNSSLPVAVSGLSANVAALATGYQHTCALLTDGSVQCWGRNDYGQLGINTSVNSSLPVVVAGLTGVISISAGTYHTCAVLNTGTAKCWGNNVSGQVGDGTVAKRLTPVSVAGVSGASAITTGLSHTCVVLSAGTVQCWGLNADGQLGNGTTVSSSTRVNVTGLTGIISVSAGQYHTCALSSLGGAKCWGNYSSGQLGNGMSGGGSAKVSLPADVTGLTSGVMTLMASSGGGSTCAILSTGVAQCWGFNSAKQLG